MSNSSKTDWFDSIGEADWFDTIGEEEIIIKATPCEEKLYEKVDWFDTEIKDSEVSEMDSSIKRESDAAEDRESVKGNNLTAEIKDFPKMGKDEHLVALALEYRKLARSKKPAKFQLITSNIFPSCACKGSKNGCRTAKCTCVGFGQECQPSCGCREGCPNMALTRGQGRKLRVESSGVHGEGCFAEEEIKKGQFVGEYTGEIVLRAEQERKKKPSLFLFEIEEKDFLLDASRFGSKLAKMNHRMKGANCEFKMKRVGGVKRVGVWALKDIGGGQELFAFYGFNYRGHGLITPHVKSVLSDVN